MDLKRRLDAARAAAAGEAALEMALDRNLVVHTYDDALAGALAGRLPSHREILQGWIEAMQRDLEGGP